MLSLFALVPVFVGLYLVTLFSAPSDGMIADMAVATDRVSVAFYLAESLMITVATVAIGAIGWALAGPIGAIVLAGLVWPIFNDLTY